MRPSAEARSLLFRALCLCSFLCRTLCRRREMDGARVYIGNLDPHVTQDEVDAECRRFGKLASVWVARNPAGFAFVVRC